MYREILVSQGTFSFAAIRFVRRPSWSVLHQHPTSNQLFCEFPTSQPFFIPFRTRVRTVLSVVRQIHFTSHDKQSHKFRLPTNQPNPTQPLSQSFKEVRALLLACADLVIRDLHMSHHISLPCPLCGVLFFHDVSFFA